MLRDARKISAIYQKFARCSWFDMVGTLLKISWFIGFEALHGEVSMNIWFVVTPMYVSTCQVEFVL